MTEELVKGIARALYEGFGDEYTIYKESPPQNFSEPCFLIMHVRGTNDMKSPTRYFRHHLIDVHYFPKDELHQKSEIRSVADRLFLSLEYINVLDNLCRGTKMSYEIIDGVLHFSVHYDMFLVKPSVDGSEMKTLESTLEVNNGS